MKLNRLFMLGALLASPALFADDKCTFDADAADSPDFMKKIVECDTKSEKRTQAAKPASTAKNEKPTKLYGEGTAVGDSGLFERPVVAAGSMNHRPGTLYAVRQAYSLRPNAKFEESVTLAMHNLHLQMAHHCSQGWEITRQWVEPNASREGDFFLHYAFRCAE